MARPLRIEYPGAFYHVYTRGLERREIFRDKKDYERLLKFFSEIHKKHRFLCHTYCLMPNHYHLYLETNLIGLSKIMQELNSRYTQSFNRRHKRNGPLFQGRYKAKLIDQDNYSLQLSRYIHLNPVKAKLVQRPEDWPWSSYPAFLGKTPPESFLETGWLMKQIGSREDLKRFTLNGLKDTWDPLEPSGRGPVLGRETFVEQIKEKLSHRPKDSSLTGLRALTKDSHLKDLEACLKGLHCQEPIKRKLLIYGLRKYTHLSLKEVGARLGGMKPVNVCQTFRRFQEEIKKDKKIASLIHKLDCKM